LVYQLDEKDNNSGYNKDIEVVQILECLGILILLAYAKKREKLKNSKSISTVDSKFDVGYLGIFWGHFGYLGIQNVSKIRHNILSRLSFAQRLEVAPRCRSQAIRPALCSNAVIDPLTQNCLLSVPSNNAPQTVFSRIVFYVDYEPAAAQGRRRRQARSSERGYASMDAQVCALNSSRLKLHRSL
jgi:hypothetical protein